MFDLKSLGRTRSLVLKGKGGERNRFGLLPVVRCTCVTASNQHNNKAHPQLIVDKGSKNIQ